MAESARPTRASRVPAAQVVVLAILMLLASGCVRGCYSSRPPIHLNPNMDYQGKLEPMESSGFFYDGSSMRLPVPGTVARGELIEDPEFHTGMTEAGEYLSRNPLEITDAVRERGAQRFGIYCQPCHDKRGNGKGILFEYGGVPTATFHDEQRRGYPDGQIFQVITNGSGLMHGYKYPISPADRWAIVAHVRRLQAEQAERDMARELTSPGSPSVEQNANGEGAS